MKPLVFNEFHLLSQLVFSWLRPYASFRALQQPPKIEGARRALPDPSLRYSFSGTFDSNGGLQCQQFLTSALGVCAWHVCSFFVCVSNRRPAMHDVGCWFCLYVSYSCYGAALFVRCPWKGQMCCFVGCAWAQWVFAAAQSSAHTLSVCVLKRVRSACVLMHISLCAQCT